MSRCSSRSGNPQCWKTITTIGPGTEPASERMAFISNAFSPKALGVHVDSGRSSDSLLAAGGIHPVQPGCGPDRFGARRAKPAFPSRQGRTVANEWLRSQELTAAGTVQDLHLIPSCLPRRGTRVGAKIKSRSFGLQRRGICLTQRGEIGFPLKNRSFQTQKTQ